LSTGFFCATVSPNAYGDEVKIKSLFSLLYDDPEKKQIGGA